MKLFEKLTKVQARVVCLLGALCVVALAVLIAVVLAREPETVQGEFTPPPFEAAAVFGVPEVDDSLGWSELEIRSGYVIGLCGVLNAEAEGTVPVWFTSDSGNDVWLKLRLYDSKGEVLGETGILRPGEYVEELQLTTVPRGTTAVTLVVMGYEPETYYSAGSVSLSTELKAPPA